jgi:hypothetical protein
LKFRVFAAPATATNDGLQVIGVCTPIRDAGAPKFLEKPQPVDTSRSALRIPSRIAPPWTAAAHAALQWHQRALLKFRAKQITCNDHAECAPSNFRTMLRDHLSVGASVCHVGCSSGCDLRATPRD